MEPGALVAGVGRPARAPKGRRVSEAVSEWQARAQRAHAVSARPLLHEKKGLAFISNSSVELPGTGARQHRSKTPDVRPAKHKKAAATRVNLEELASFYSCSRSLTKRELMGSLRLSHKAKSQTLKHALSQQQRSPPKSPQNVAASPSARPIRRLASPASEQTLELIAKGTYQSIESLFVKLSDPSLRGEEWRRLAEALLLTFVRVATPLEAVNIVIQILEDPPQPGDLSPPAPIGRPLPPPPSHHSSLETSPLAAAAGPKFVPTPPSIPVPHPFMGGGGTATPATPRSFERDCTSGGGSHDHAGAHGDQKHGIVARLAGTRPSLGTTALFQRHKLKVFNVLKLWIKSYPQDFTRAPDGPHTYARLRDALSRFPPTKWHAIVGTSSKSSLVIALRTVSGAVLTTLRKTVSAALSGDECKGAATARKTHPSSTHTSISTQWTSSGDAQRRMSVRNALEPHVSSERGVAEQLVLLSLERVAAARPRDFVGASATGAKIQTKLSSLASDWVSTEILTQPNAPRMAKMVRAWIDIAYHSVRLQNFGTAFEILYGITRHSVSRLFKFLSLPPATTARLDRMKDLISPCGNFKKYRKALRDARASGRPLLPYFGIMTRDLFSLESARPKPHARVALPQYGVDLVRVLHVRRSLDTARTIQAVLRCRHSDFNIAREPSVLRILRAAKQDTRATEAQLMALSERARPRGATEIFGSSDQATGKTAGKAAGILRAAKSIFTQ